MTLARTARPIGAIALLLTALIAPPNATAASTPHVRVGVTTCEDGLGTAHLTLYAADTYGSTFTTRLTDERGAEVFNEQRVLAANEEQSIAIPDLFYGDYRLWVLVGGKQIKQDSVVVGCTPTQPYKRPSLLGYQGCDRDSTYVIENTPIPGAVDLLEPVHFVIAVQGVKKLLETDLPDGDADPYRASVTVYWDDYDEPVVVTADGVDLPVMGWAVPGCIETPEAPLPSTGG